jgi:hypothetical protein
VSVSYLNQLCKFERRYDKNKFQDIYCFPSPYTKWKISKISIQHIRSRKRSRVILCKQPDLDGCLKIYDNFHGLLDMLILLETSRSFPTLLFWSLSFPKCAKFQFSTWFPHGQDESSTGRIQYRLLPTIASFQNRFGLNNPLSTDGTKKNDGFSVRWPEVKINNILRIIRPICATIYNGIFTYLFRLTQLETYARLQRQQKTSSCCNFDFSSSALNELLDESLLGELSIGRFSVPFFRFNFFA